jgi:hypothetical protein
MLDAKGGGVGLVHGTALVVIGQDRRCKRGEDGDQRQANGV